MVNTGDGLGDLDAATAAYHRTEKAHRDNHDKVVAAIIDALKRGEMPTKVADHSPFTAAHVRKLARDAGIPPARPGIKPRKTSGGQ